MMRRTAWPNTRRCKR